MRASVQPKTVDGFKFVSTSEAMRYEGLKAFAGRVMNSVVSPDGRMLICTWGDPSSPQRTQTFKLKPSASRRGVGWKPRTPEKAVQAQVVHLLRSVGGRVYVLGTKRPSGDYQGTCQTPGLADIHAFLPVPTHGVVTNPSLHAVWVEVKAEGGRLSDEQESFQQHCRDAHVSHVVGGVNDVVAFLVHGGWLKAESVAHYRSGASSQGRGIL